MLEHQTNHLALIMPPFAFRATIKIVNGNPFVPVSAARAKAIKPDWRKPLSGKRGRFMGRSW